MDLKGNPIFFLLCFEIAEVGSNDEADDDYDNCFFSLDCGVMDQIVNTASSSSLLKDMPFREGGEGWPCF